VVDCVIVTTLSKTNLFGLFIRVAMSICLSIVLAEPALLFLFQKTIDTRIQEELDVGRNQKEKELNDSLKTANEGLARVVNNLRDLRRQLDEFSVQAVAQQRTREIQKRKTERLALIAGKKQRQIDGKKKLLADLEAKVQAKGGEIEAKMLEMQSEDEGRRRSRKQGQGPFWRKLDGERSQLEEERKALEQQIVAAKAEVDQIRADNTDETKVDEQFDDLLISESATVELSEDEKERKEIVRKEFEILTERQNFFRDMVAAKEIEIGKLADKFDISARTDSLTQTKTLLVIAFESPVMFIKILSLFFLVFFIDTAPVFIKLTAKTGYDEYLKSLARQRTLQATRELDEYLAAAIASAKKINDQMMDYKDHMNVVLSRSNGNRSELAEDVNFKINEVLLKHTDGILSKIDQAEGKSRSISLFEALERSWARLKRRIILGA
ncbi:MAG: DUF4407 domain-containing protein, partial [Methylococcales bacterium]